MAIHGVPGFAPVTSGPKAGKQCKIRPGPYRVSLMNVLPVGQGCFLGACSFFVVCLTVDIKANNGRKEMADRRLGRDQSGQDSRGSAPDGKTG